MIIDVSTPGTLTSLYWHFPHSLHGLYGLGTDCKSYESLHCWSYSHNLSPFLVLSADRTLGRVNHSLAGRLPAHVICLFRLPCLLKVGHVESDNMVYVMQKCTLIKYKVASISIFCQYIITHGSARAKIVTISSFLHFLISSFPVPAFRPTPRPGIGHLGPCTYVLCAIMLSHMTPGMARDGLVPRLDPPGLGTRLG